MLLRNLIFAVSVGLIAAIIANGALLLTAYNLPEEVLRPDANDRAVDRVLVGVMLFLAPLLATAPVIEWWYRRLGRAMKIYAEMHKGQHEDKDEL